MKTEHSRTKTRHIDKAVAAVFARTATIINSHFFASTGEFGNSARVHYGNGNQAFFIELVFRLSVAKKEVSEFTSAPIDLGAFAPVTTVISVAEPGFAGDNAADLDGKKVEKIVVKANKTIAYTEAKYDLATGELQGAEALPLDHSSISRGGLRT